MQIISLVVLRCRISCRCWVASNGAW